LFVIKTIEIKKGDLNRLV